jgi:hypothetical protein
MQLAKPFDKQEWQCGVQPLVVRSMSNDTTACRRIAAKQFSEENKRKRHGTVDFLQGELNAPYCIGRACP